MNRKIIIHKPPHHLDEVMAVAEIFNPGDEILKISPQDPIPEIGEAGIVVDVGGRFDGQRFFDHHQDKNLPSAFGLVANLDEQNPKSKKIWDFVESVSKGDTRGEKNWGVLGPMLQALVLEIFNLKGGPEIISQAWQEIKKTIRKTEEALEKVEIREINGRKIAIVKDVVPGIVNEIGATIEKVDVLVMRNQFNGSHTSVIKMRESDVEIEVRNAKIVFNHSAGFLVVIDIPVEEVEKDINQFIKIVK